jgi:tripartite-type tricarboxylate transporter receptor subunit TctC
VYFPAKTPAPIVNAMQELLKETFTAPNLTRRMARAAFGPLNYSVEQLGALRADSAKIGRLVGPPLT